MDLIVRAVDVGSGNTKYVVGTEGTEIRCASFPSIAYPSASETQAWSASERRKTVSIPIGHLFYEVGPDVHLVADSVRATQLHDEYTDTPEYMALLRGALHLMKQSRIDLLVVGLPVALLHLKKAALEKAMTGTHDVGGGKTVTVVKALAVAQPQGALAHYASVHKKMATIGNEQSLIIDPGSRTFDWLVARGMRQVQKQSHSFNRGMSDVLRLIAAEITKDIGSPYRDLDAIDLALRTGKQPVIFQKSYDITRFMPMAEAVAQQAVSAMKQYIESPHSLQNIILVGGGDPTLSRTAPGQQSVYRDAPKLSTLAVGVNAKMAGTPITKIIVDASLYTGATWEPSWERSEMTQGYMSEVTALQVDGVIELADEKRLALAVQQDVAQGLAIEGGVDRHRHIPRHLDCQIRQDPVGAVFAYDGDPAARGPALALQPLGHAPHLAGRLGPGQVQYLPASHGLREIDRIWALVLPAVQASQRKVGRLQCNCLHGLPSIVESIVGLAPVHPQWW